MKYMEHKQHKPSVNHFVTFQILNVTNSQTQLKLLHIESETKVRNMCAQQVQRKLCTSSCSVPFSVSGTATVRALEAAMIFCFSWFREFRQPWWSDKKMMRSAGCLSCLLWFTGTLVWASRRLPLSFSFIWQLCCYGDSEHSLNKTWKRSVENHCSTNAVPSPSVL